MQVTLPSGNTIGFRDEMMRGDSRAIRRGTKFVFGPDGSRVVDAAFADDLTGRIVTQMMTDWSFGHPTPAQCQGEDLAQRRLDEVMTGADWMALQMALAPWVSQILTSPTAGTAFTHNGTGVRVTVADEEDAAKLAASPDFTPVAAAGPKSTPTATSGAALPPGQEVTTAPGP